MEITENLSFDSIQFDLVDARIIKNNSQFVKIWCSACLAELLRLSVHNQPYNNYQLKVQN